MSIGSQTEWPNVGLPDRKTALAGFNFFTKDKNEAALSQAVPQAPGPPSHQHWRRGTRHGLGPSSLPGVGVLRRDVRSCQDSSRSFHSGFCSSERASTKIPISLPRCNLALAAVTVANSVLWPCPSAMWPSLQGQGQASDWCSLSKELLVGGPFHIALWECSGL